MKDARHHYSLGKCKLKLQQDITTYNVSTRVAKITILITPNNNKTVEQLNFHTLLVLK